MDIQAINIHDVIFSLEEAAAFMTVSPEWLTRSDVPRSRLAVGNKRGRIVFLKSKCIEYVASHQIGKDARDAA